MQKKLIFDKESHTYYLDGVRIPSATQLLKPVSKEIYHGINPAILEKASIRGSAVHEMLENLINGKEVDLSNYPKESWDYFEAVNRWYDNNKEIVSAVTATEYITYGCIYGQYYGATIDVFGDNFIIDFKTRKVKPEIDRLQLFLYNQTFLDGNKRKLYIVSILKDGIVETRYLDYDNECERRIKELVEVFQRKEKML